MQGGSRCLLKVQKVQAASLWQPEVACCSVTGTKTVTCNVLSLLHVSVYLHVLCFASHVNGIGAMDLSLPLHVLLQAAAFCHDEPAYRQSAECSGTAAPAGISRAVTCRLLRSRQQRPASHDQFYCPANYRQSQPNTAL